MRTTINYSGIEIEMEAIPMAEINKDELICDSRCPYSKNCTSFPDPREKLLGIKDVDFSDFCIDLDECINPAAEGLIENCGHIPVSGSLEKLFTIEKIPKKGN